MSTVGRPDDPAPQQFSILSNNGIIPSSEQAGLFGNLLSEAGQDEGDPKGPRFAQGGAQRKPTATDAWKQPGRTPARRPLPRQTGGSAAPKGWPSSSQSSLPTPKPGAPAVASSPWSILGRALGVGALGMAAKQSLDQKGVADRMANVGRVMDHYVLDRNSRENVQAAIAYVWTRSGGARSDLGFSEKQWPDDDKSNHAAAEAVLKYELEHPNTLGTATREGPDGEKARAALRGVISGALGNGGQTGEPDKNDPNPAGQPGETAAPEPQLPYVTAPPEGLEDLPPDGRTKDGLPYWRLDTIDNARANRDAAGSPGGLLGRNISVAAQGKAPSAQDVAVARGLASDLNALPMDVIWTPNVINSKDPQLAARLAEAGLNDLVGWEGKANTLRQAGISEEIINKLRGAAIVADQPVINKSRTLTTPSGQQIELPPIASSETLEARKWYKSHVPQVPELIDKTAPLEEQARQAFDLRNAFRNGARSSMKDRQTLADALTKDPDMTWEQVVGKYKQDYQGEELWKAIINATVRSRYDNPNYNP